MPANLTIRFSQWPGGIPSPGNPRPTLPSGNPYAGYGSGPPPPRRSLAWLWILLAIAGGGVAVCCGCSGIFYLGFNRNLAAMESDLKAKLSADPEAQARLGVIEDVELDLLASVQASEGQAEKRMVFHVRGTKGSGDVVGYIHAEGGRETLEECQLKMPNGDEVDLSF